MPFVGPLEDRVAIRELFDAYSDAVCRFDKEAWAALWAEDSNWSLPDYPEYPDVKGKTAITDMWVTAMNDYTGIIFVTTPGSINVNGDVAVATCYTSEVFDKDGQCHRHRGYYEDELVKIDGCWLFKNRSFRNIHKQEV